MKPSFKYQVFFVFLAVFGFIFQPLFSAYADNTQDQINQLQQQIEQYQQQINQIHSQTVTLQSQVTALNDQINQITLEIKGINLSISQTNAAIQETQNQISQAEDQISKDQVVLGQYLELVYQSDQESLVNILLKNNNLSDFFNDLNSIETNQNNLKTTIDSIKQLDTSLNAQEQVLESKENDLEHQQGLAEVDKRNLDQSQAQKNVLLKQSKGQESQVQSKIAELQQEIYYLEQNGVSVQDAIKYGNLAAIATGIRPAFLLAELDQESGILDPTGGNVGKCYVKNFTNGDGARIDTGAAVSRVMSPSRDIQPFLQITQSLGLDPSATRVSCWPGTYYHHQPYGWGGAMGPAQFIPSTWLGYADRVAALVGHPANPWNVQDAFTAAAIKFAKDGATSQTAAGEIAASKAYYCGNPRSTSYDCVHYANNVQALEAQIQQNL